MRLREEIEKNGEDYFEHIEQKHNLWRYVFYLTYLEKKDRNEYSGFENMVYDTLLEEPTKIFPRYKGDEEMMFNMFVKESFKTQTSKLISQEEQIKKLTQLTENCLKKIDGKTITPK
jgi:hypothetical protein